MKKEFKTLVEETNKTLFEARFVELANNLAKDKDVNKFLKQLENINESVVPQVVYDVINRYILPDTGKFIALLQKALRNNVNKKEADDILNTIHDNWMKHKDETGRNYSDSMGLGLGDEKPLTSKNNINKGQ